MRYVVTRVAMVPCAIDVEVEAPGPEMAMRYAERQELPRLRDLVVRDVYVGTSGYRVVGQPTGGAAVDCREVTT